MNQDDIAYLNELVDIIRNDESISKGMLYKKCKIGIWKFKELTRYLPDLYTDIHYDKKKQVYTTLSHTPMFFIPSSMCIYCTCLTYPISNL